MICANTVFRCFKSIERAANYITGAAGPYFVALAVGLITMGTVCFFDVVAPTLSYPFLTIPICVLIALNLFGHYYYVITVPPGFIDDPPREHGANHTQSSWLWAKKTSSGNGKGRHQRVLTGGVRWSARGVKITSASMTRCNKCGRMRPERAHHCRICNKCVLKYDHHCPVRINQCVGLHNERHFVLFMAYLVLATFLFCLTGYPIFLESLGINFNYRAWPYHVPEIMYLMTFILCIVLCFAVGVMLAYHLYGISHAETSVEAQDFEEYRKRATGRNEEFVNSYHLGALQNLALFLNISFRGRGDPSLSYSLLTLVLPLRANPYTDGHSWARRDGYETGHVGVRKGEELTDEEEYDV